MLSHGVVFFVYNFFIMQLYVLFLPELNVDTTGLFFVHFGICVLDDYLDFYFWTAMLPYGVVYFLLIFFFNITLYIVFAGTKYRHDRLIFFSFWNMCFRRLSRLPFLNHNDTTQGNFFFYIFSVMQLCVLFLPELNIETTGLSFSHKF